MPTARILIFSQMSRQRDLMSVVESLTNSFPAGVIERVILTTYHVDENDTGARMHTGLAYNRCVILIQRVAPWPKLPKMLSQQAFEKIWTKKHSASKVVFEPTIRRALEAARKIRTETRSMQALVIGSQHLVGGALRVLRNTKEAA